MNSQEIRSAVPPPLFTDDDELRESATATPEEIAASTADMCGLAESLSNCWVSEDDAMPEALYMLDRELEEIVPRDRKGAFLEAQRICPDLVDDKHKEAFLWTENLDPTLAAERLVAYWEFRHEIFGPAKCFMPMTLHGAMRDDIAALTALRMHVLPAKDSAGRAVIFYNPPPDFTQCGHESLARALCYFCHTLFEDHDAQKRGAILLSSPGDEEVGLLHFERQRFLSKAYHLANCFPGRLRAQHIIKPRASFIALRIAMALMNRMMRRRIIHHVGSNEDVLTSLGRFGLSKDELPSEIGGAVILDKNAWIASRRALEGDYSNLSSLTASTQHDISTSKLSFAEVGGIGLTLDQLYAAKSARNPTVAMQLKPARLKGGRKADPRMNRAVTARLNDPHLSLLDALLAGGFTFAEGTNQKNSAKTIFDKDGVSLAQRKNQLLRRLRSLKK